MRKKKQDVAAAADPILAAVKAVQSGEVAARNPDATNWRAPRGRRKAVPAPGRSKPRPDREHKETAALRGVVGNVTATSREVVVWFVQEPQSLSFRPDPEVEELMASAAAQVAELTGKRVFWRVTTRPYAVRQYAEATHADALAAGNPLPGWEDMLDREQRHMLGASLAEKWCYFGVRVATSRRYPKDARREVAALREVIADVTDRVSGHGLEAKPATPVDMEWLLRRSVGLGLPAPEVDRTLISDYDGDDLPELTEHARWSCEPFSKVLQVTGLAPNGREVTRYVAVLTLGRMETMNVPQDPGGGWMQRTDRLPFPVEWMCTVDVQADEKVVGKLRHQMDVIRDQWAHYVEDHQIDPPESLKRQRAQALASEDEVSQGLGGLATRTEGWYRLAVWGDSEAEALQNVRAVTKLYGRQVAWWHSWDQYRLGREFIPGEPLANSAARRRMNVAALAAALPAATAEVGDRFGAVLGWTSGTSKRAAVWHPWIDMEKFDRSGLLLVAGELGSGKTVASASLVYRTVMAGARWVVFDPSGRLGSLCTLPEVKHCSRYIDLLKGRDGELNPYRVVAEPIRSHFDIDEHGRQVSVEEADLRYREALSEAAAQRSSLCKDILSNVLPKQTRSTQQATSVMTRAVARVPGRPTASPLDVLEQLQLIADGVIEGDLTPEYRIVARDIHTELTEISKTPKGRLIFPAATVESAAAEEPLLTVYSLHGLTLPDASQMQAAADESPDTRMSLVLFNLAAWLTQRSIYLGDPNERKGLFIDEGHLLNAIPGGKSLVRKSSVDSRKHNARVILSSQNVTHYDQGEIGNLVGAALIGRTEDREAGLAALKVLKVKPDPSYLVILGRLSQRSRRGSETEKKYREFIFSDGRGAAERIVFDMYAHPHVMAALNTTADPTRSREEVGA